jgi:6-phosphofructo-2-kinase/fructose-2,6-biphosphatase
MPAAAGAVAAAAVADQMLGPKEDRHLAIVLVFPCMIVCQNS